MVSLRTYQQELKTLSGNTPGNVLLQADTGAGKTRVLAAIADEHNDVILIAHRNILIKQISRELASHDILATITTKLWVFTMKKVLVKYKQLKILIDETADIEPLIANIDEISSLNDDVISMYKNLLSTPPEQAEQLQKRVDLFKPLVDQLGIVGVPFQNKDAELYAADKKIMIVDRLEIEV